jgi:polar amino acid transport system ATP-binding protein
MITVENVLKDFGQGPILKDVSLTFKEGEVTVIMGPSGSGKSTLLRCLNFLEVPTQGQVMFEDITLIETPTILQSVRQEVAMVFQSFYLFNHMTALENCALAPRKVLGLSKEAAMKRAEEALVEVGLKDFFHRLPKTLSGGQKQRVAIARALAMQPKVILFDEPTSALDPENVQEVLQTIAALAAKKMTLIVVTHEMGFAKKVADRVIFMDEGNVVEDEKAQAFFIAPKTERARNFIKNLSY